MATEAERNLMRLLIGDVITQNMVEIDLIFSDAELDAFFVYEGCSPYRAAAYGLEVIANSIALNEGQRTDLSFSVNGISVAGALRKRAVELRAIRESYKL